MAARPSMMVGGGGSDYGNPREFKIDAKEMFVWADKMTVPEWIDKGEAKECTGCKDKLKSSNAHNCRLCGLLFCGDCTGKYQLPAKFEKKGKGTSRVCASCCRKALKLKEAVLAHKDVAKQEAVIRASAAPEPTFVQTHLAVVWEDAPSKVVCSVPIIETMPLQRIHQSITRTYALNDGTFHYLCRGQPVHKLFWDIFTAKYVAPTLVLRKVTAAPIDEPAPEGQHNIKAVAADFSKAAALESVDWAKLNQAEEKKAEPEPESETFVRPVIEALSAVSTKPAQVSAPPAGFKLEEVKVKPREVPKDFKQEKEAPKPEPIVFKSDGLPKTIQFVDLSKMAVLTVDPKGLPALPPPPPGFEAYIKAAPPTAIPGMPSDFKLLMPSEIAAGAVQATAAAAADDDDEDDGIDDGKDDMSAPTLTAEQLKEAEAQKAEDDNGEASEDDEPVPAPKRIVAIPAPPPKRGAPAPALATSPPNTAPPNPMMAAGATSPPAVSSVPRPSTLPVSPTNAGGPRASVMPGGAALISPTNAAATAPPRQSVMPNAGIAAAIAANAASQQAAPAKRPSMLVGGGAPNGGAALVPTPPAPAVAATPTPPATPALDPDALAPGWTEHTNPADQRKYYHNKSTKVSTFDRPTNLKMNPGAFAAAPPVAAAPTATAAPTTPAPNAAAASMMGGMAAAAAAAAARRAAGGAALNIPMRLPGAPAPRTAPAPTAPRVFPGAAAAAQPVQRPDSLPPALKAEIHAPPPRPQPAGNVRAPPPPPARKIDKFQASGF